MSDVLELPYARIAASDGDPQIRRRPRGAHAGWPAHAGCRFAQRRGATLHLRINPLGNRVGAQLLERHFEIPSRRQRIDSCCDLPDPALQPRPAGRASGQKSITSNCGYYQRRVHRVNLIRIKVWDSQRSQIRSYAMIGATFDSTKTPPLDLLARADSGQLQLPDFQRGWVWDDERIRSLLARLGGAALQKLRGAELGRDRDHRQSPLSAHSARALSSVRFS